MLLIFVYILKHALNPAMILYVFNLHLHIYVSEGQNQVKYLFVLKYSHYNKYCIEKNILFMSNRCQIIIKTFITTTPANGIAAKKKIIKHYTMK